MKTLLAQPLYSSVNQVPVLYRADYDGGRHYYKVTDSGLVFFDSWTSVIDRMLGYDVGLVTWIAGMGWEASQKYMKERAHYGTILHILIGEFLKNGRMDIERGVSFHATSYAMTEKLDTALTNSWLGDLRRDLLSFVQFVHEKELTPIAVEMPLALDEWSIAGTIDLVCTLKFGQKRITAIVDIKSGRKGFYPSHRYQLHGYKMTWEANFPDMPIDMVFNWSPKDWTGDTPTYNFTNQTKCDEGAALPHLLAMHRVFNSKVSPGEIVVCEGDVVLGEAAQSAWRKVNLAEILATKHEVE